LAVDKEKPSALSPKIRAVRLVGQESSTLLDNSSEVHQDEEKFPSLVSAHYWRSRLFVCGVNDRGSKRSNIIPRTEQRLERIEEVKIKLVRDNGKIVAVTQFVGKWITVKFNGQSFGFVPKVDDETGAVSLILHSIGGDVGDSIRPAKELETIGVSKVSPARSSTANLPFSIMMDEMSDTSGQPVQPTPCKQLQFSTRDRQPRCARRTVLPEAPV
jgi:hypothetical protein